MSFLQLTLAIGSADPGPVEDVLMAAGASSITLEDAEDNPVLEPAPGTTPLWPRVNLKALFDAEASRESILAALREAFGTKFARAQFEIVEDRIWEREWLKDFKPMRFGRRLWICPGGQRPPAEPQNANPESLPHCIITLDPGLAFGTGTHPTTALCLEWLDMNDVRDKRVIDYGCGSGVLAIAALLLGAREVFAVDIDEQALQATKDNAQRNGVADRLHVSAVEGLNELRADVVLANILAQPLKELAPRFGRLVSPGGQIVLSGVLVLQAQEVAACYTPWFDIAPASLRDDWARLDGARRVH
jgi:ribosomal protein L11 methyltransferase